MIDDEHLATLLPREKINVVFALCGGHIMPIFRGLLD